MSRIHKIVKASSEISHLSSHLSISDTFRLTLSHTVPFPVLFFCTEHCQKSLQLSKNAGNHILSCCQRAKLGFKYIFNIHWQKLRTGLEPEIWVKSEGLFLPICHTLQGSGQLSEKETLNHKPSVSRANPLMSAFLRNRDIAKSIRSGLKLQIFHVPYWQFLLEKCLWVPFALGTLNRVYKTVWESPEVEVVLYRYLLLNSEASFLCLATPPHLFAGAHIYLNKPATWSRLKILLQGGEKSLLKIWINSSIYLSSITTMPEQTGGRLYEMEQLKEMAKSDQPFYRGKQSQ